jgi:hypothetical protein
LINSRHVQFRSQRRDRDTISSRRERRMNAL